MQAQAQEAEANVAKVEQWHYPEPLARLVAGRLKHIGTVPEIVEEYGSVGEYFRSRGFTLKEVDRVSRNHLLAQLYFTDPKGSFQVRMHTYSQVVQLDNFAAGFLPNEIKLSIADSIRNDDRAGYLEYDVPKLVTKMFRASSRVSEFGLLYQVLRIPNVLNLLKNYNDAEDVKKAVKTLYGSLVGQHWSPDMLRNSVVPAMHNLVNRSILEDLSFDNDKSALLEADDGVSIDDIVADIHQIDNNPFLSVTGEEVEKAVFWENGYPYLPLR